MWANNRTVLGLHCPELVPRSHLLASKLVDTLSSWLLAFGLVWGWAQFATKVRCLESFCWVLCFLASLFSWERNKSTQLSARFLWLPCPHCAAASSQEQMSQQGSRLLCWHCLFPPFSHSIFLLQSSNFLPFVFDCVEKIGQASIAHFKNEMLGYIALQWEDPLCILK